ncbi:MAG: DNA polymerase I [Syntrophorhabdus sp. PtaU1.Bin050]|nr:MAG: DNA polymerase I [Syntrophorhabdus sp. PtaU1.Bin050]
MSENSELRTPNSEPDTRKRVFLVDGNSYLYRAFFATPHLSNSKGIPTNATYAFLSMTRKLVNEQKPDALIMVFDSKAPSFREEISKAYKAQRPPMPGNLSVQIPYVKSALEAMGLPILEKEGFEADDIIGTIVHSLKGRDVEIYIVTSDKDMMQLVSKNVFILDTMKGTLIGEGEVEEKFGIKPALITDYLALCGDTSDNIPGVPGIGEKTARELVSTIGSVDEIYGRLEEIRKPAVKSKLVTGKDLAHMSKDLATIRLDVPVDTSIDNLRMKEPDLKNLRRIYRALEFTTLYREIRLENEDRKEWKRVNLDELKKQRIALLAGFHGKNVNDIGLESFVVFDGEGIFTSESTDDLVRVLADAEEIVTHNLKPLYAFGASREGVSKGLDLSSLRFFDTMLATYLTNPLRKDYGVAAVAEELLDLDLASHDPGRIMVDVIPHLFDLKAFLEKNMAESDLSNLFLKTEMPLVQVLADMECAGVKVDRSKLLALSRDFDKRLNGIIKEIYSLAGEPFNINSPQQLSRVLFDTLKLPPLKKTKTGYSTDTEVLQTLSLQHPLPKEILEYRTLTKLKGTYIDVLPTLINPHSGRIHASFNQMVAATGRLSSSDPNLQNIPIRGEEGMKIREAFVPEDGYILVSSDYSQIELRVLAHISGDQVLIDTFLRDEDIHSRVAREVFGVAEGGVTQEMRRTAKVINFGIIYGMSSYGLAKELGILQRDAQSYIDDYFVKHQGVSRYMSNVVEEARQNGFVRTLFGRIRYIPEINNPDTNVRQLGERAAMNTPIQGTAADIIKIAMVNIHRKIKARGLSSQLIMQIHDELVFEVKEEELAVMEPLIKEGMEQAVSLAVPLKVSLGKGHNWAEAHD